MVVMVVVVALAGLALGWGTHTLRRSFIRSFFREGPASAPPPLTRAPPSQSGPGVSAVARLRVLLIDGLAAETAATLPHLNALCARGLDLSVDVGFPTVSLPVQSVLWTGRTQQQSGRPYQVSALPSPPPGALPILVPGSLALAEEQPFIAGSFGFGLRTAEVPGDEGLGAAAATLVAGPERLAFVHLLRVDKAGHKAGRGSPLYQAAAGQCDAILGRMLLSAPAAPDLRWVVLSDHGHRPACGHGGAERELRLVRACISGLPPVAGDAAYGPIHLVDLSRVLFDSLGQPPSPDSAGRPLAFARAHPDRDATVLRPGGMRLAAVIVMLVLGWLAAARQLTRQPAGPGLFLQVLWLPVAYFSAALWRGIPTLSNPMVYPPLGRDMVLAALPGLALGAAGVWLSARRAPERLPAMVGAAWMLGVTPALAALVGAGFHRTVFGGGPPLIPLFSAHASFFLALSSAAAPLLTLSGVAAALQSWRPWSPGSSGSGPRPSPSGQP